MLNGEQFAVHAGCLKCSLWKEREIPCYASIWTKGVEVKGHLFKFQRFSNLEKQNLNCGLSSISNKNWNSLLWFLKLRTAKKGMCFEFKRSRVRQKLRAEDIDIAILNS